MATRRHPRCLTGDAFHRPPTGLGGDAFADVISGIAPRFVRALLPTAGEDPKEVWSACPFDHSMGT